jgi:hypothetical protein
VTAPPRSVLRGNGTEPDSPRKSSDVTFSLRRILLVKNDGLQVTRYSCFSTAIGSIAAARRAGT